MNVHVVSFNSLQLHSSQPSSRVKCHRGTVSPADHRVQDQLILRNGTPAGEEQEAGPTDVAFHQHLQVGREFTDDVCRSHLTYVPFNTIVVLVM